MTIAYMSRFCTVHHNSALSVSIERWYTVRLLKSFSSFSTSAVALASLLSVLSFFSSVYEIALVCIKGIQVKVPIEWLVVALTHVDESLRVDAAESLSRNPKTSSLLSQLELNLMRQAVPLNMLCTSSAFQMKWTSLFKKFFSRGRTALGRQMRQGTWKRVVFGVQPTGALHLRNYLGAIKNRVPLQDNYDTFFFIVDLHAIALPYDAQELSRATRDVAASYLACGTGPSKTSVFVQSHVRAHVGLMWLLSSATPIGWLNRMIQFKEKSHKVGDKNMGVALLTFPILMASDIFLYQPDFVPVSEDQLQHLELKRELAERGNYLYGERKWKKMGGRGGTIFKIPEPLTPPAGA
ncbi:hypothetical protein Nepgr_015728 [Nepenthes gracilis]|uniref:tryptophan--tRNA ligase n=1 Tax=Nepenthes gracilis TaxID=150966 RepID=A0AAD3XQM4_NEPGR|nr:hypothetical protein Nepgr_015728 [Nepenthes gracilis]